MSGGGDELELDYEQAHDDDHVLSSHARNVTGSTSEFTGGSRGLRVGGGRYVHVAEEVLGGVEDIGQDVEKAFSKTLDAHGSYASKIADDVGDTDRDLASKLRDEPVDHDEPRDPGDPGGVPTPPASGAGGGDGGSPGDGAIRSQGEGGRPQPDAPHPRNPLDLVPPDADTPPFEPSPSIPRGARYDWTDEQGRRVRLHVHEADSSAPAGSNAANGPTYRVRIGSRYVDGDGKSYHPKAFKEGTSHYDPNFSQNTHIPWPVGSPLPWES